MYVIEITEDKFDGLYENAEKMLKYGGKLMNCLEEVRNDRYGERNRMPDYRDRGERRGGMREREEHEDMRHREERGRGERDYRGYDGEY